MTLAIASFQFMASYPNEIESQLLSTAMMINLSCTNLFLVFLCPKLREIIPFPSQEKEPESEYWQKDRKKLRDVQSEDEILTDLRDLERVVLSGIL